MRRAESAHARGSRAGGRSERRQDASGEALPSGGALPAGARRSGQSGLGPGDRVRQHSRGDGIDAQSKLYRSTVLQHLGF